MWIYTKNGFYSIVQDRTDPDYLVVRARVKGDIENLWPNPKERLTTIFAPIEETPDNDYRYRIRVPKDVVANLIAYEVTEIDYPNYKDCISDKRRSPYYGSVWAAMADMQEYLINDTKKE